MTCPKKLIELNFNMLSITLLHYTFLGITYVTKAPVVTLLETRCMPLDQPALNVPPEQHVGHLTVDFALDQATTMTQMSHFLIIIPLMTVNFHQGKIQQNHTFEKSFYCRLGIQSATIFPVERKERQSMQTFQRPLVSTQNNNNLAETFRSSRGNGIRRFSARARRIVGRQSAPCNIWCSIGRLFGL